MKPQIGSNQSLIKDRNQNLIITEIRSSGMVSRSELAKRLQLSNPSISKHVDELLSVGLIREIGPAPTEIGRRPVMLEFNSGYGCVAVIELVNKDSRICIADLCGERIEYIRMTNDLNIGPELIEQIKLNLGGVLSELGSKVGPLRAICLCLAGRVDDNSGKILYADHIENYDELDVVGPFSDAFHVPVIVKNGLELAIWGEHTKGLGQNVDDLVFVFIDHTFDISIISQGVLLRGAHGMSCNVEPLVSFASVSPDTFSESPSKINVSASYYLSCNRVVILARKFIEGGEQSVIQQWSSVEDITFDDIVKAYSLGDSVAISAVVWYIHKLASVIHNLNCIIDTGLIIIGGDITRLGKPFIDELNRIVRIMAGSYPAPEIKITELLGDAVIIGGVDAAIRCAIDDVIR